MIAVIFEVLPSESGYADYLAHASRLRPLLDGFEGFNSIERFASISTPSKIVSLSFWRDEAAIKAWREHAEHRNTQAAGRAGVFTDYRLRVAQVERDYGLFERGQAPSFHRALPASRCPILPSGLW